MNHRNRCQNQESSDSLMSNKVDWKTKSEDIEKDCLSYFPVAQIRHHNQGNLQKEWFIGGLHLQRVSIHDNQRWKHGSSHAGMAQEQWLRTNS